MSSLADLPELVGFFSYSREDDQGAFSALSTLRERIQHELRAQLGRTAKTFRIWQDKEAIPSGALWESEIKNSVAQSVFFIPIITPTVIASPYCRFELESFLAREAALGRDDLVFPILYIDVPELEDDIRRQADPVLSLIAKRQYVDWREFRYLDVNSQEVKRAIGRLCTDIRNALHRGWISPEDAAESRGETAESVTRSAAQRGAAGEPAPARSPMAVDDRATAGARSEEMRTRRLNRARYGVLVTLAIGVLLTFLAALVGDTISLLAAVGGTALGYAYVYRNIPRDLATARLVFLILTGILACFLLGNVQAALANAALSIRISYAIIEAIDMAVSLFVLYHLQRAMGMAQSNHARPSR